jgi:hypothetical protein
VNASDAGSAVIIVTDWLLALRIERPSWGATIPWRRSGGKNLRMSRGSDLVHHFALGPALSSRVGSVESKSDLERTAWDRGVASAAYGLDQPRSAAGALQAIAAFVTGGFFAGVSLDSVPWLLQLVGFAGAGLATYWAVPTIWAMLVALDAPRRQRNEARDAVVEERGKVQKAREDAQQARRDAVIAQLEMRLQLAKARGLQLASAIEQTPRDRWQQGLVGTSASAQLRQWASDMASILHQGGRADLAEQFVVRADDLVAESRRLQTILAAGIDWRVEQ